MKKKAVAEEVQLTVLKTSTCPTLTGRSKLTYELGQDVAGDLNYRITGNSGGGFWSKEWVAWRMIQPVISKVSPVTSTPLKSLFRGRSVNTSGFLLAVLIGEGILEIVPEKRRQFRVTGATPSADKSAAPKAISAKPPKAVPKKPK